MTLLLVCSCGPARVITSTAQESERIQVRESVTFVPCLVTVRIPEIQETRRTRDTSSHLENKYAASDAIVHPDGTLEHSLRTKPQETPQIVNVPRIQRDSVIERSATSETQTETIREVERPLSRWQRFRLAAFWPLLAFAIIALARFIRQLLHYP